MLIYIALNIAVILTETRVTKAKQVGFNQPVTRINFSEIRTNKENAHIRVCLRDGKTLKLQYPHSTEEITAGVDQRTCCRGNLIPLAFFSFIGNSSANDWQWDVQIQCNLPNNYYFNYTWESVIFLSQWDSWMLICLRVFNFLCHLQRPAGWHRYICVEN